MKSSAVTRLHPTPRGWALWAGSAAALLLVLPPVRAATPTLFTSTGWVIGVPVPGIWHTNALGQVLVRGNAHLARVESSDARLTGQPNHEDLPSPPGAMNHQSAPVESK
jgi:hypothetical protein